MANITFDIDGNYPPFGLELRLGSNIAGTLLDSFCIETTGTTAFTGVTTVGDHIIVVYDHSNGIKASVVNITGATTTTTTTTLPTTTTTTTTTLPTTTTTTLPPTTTTTTTTTLPPPPEIDFSFLNGNLNYFTSPDDGITWNENLTNYGGLNPLYTYTNIMLNSSTFLLGATKLSFPPYASVIYTTDGGSTWLNGAGFTGTTTNKGIVSGNILGENVYVAERTNTLIADRVWKSTNNGVNWTVTTHFDSVFTKIGSSERDLVSLNSYQNKAIATSTRAEMIRTLDGGITWSNITPAFMTPLNASVTSRFMISSFGNTIIVPINNYIGNTTDVYKSTNFGDSWTLIYSISGVYNSAYFQDENVGIIVKQDLSDVIYTTNGFASTTNKLVTSVSPSTYNFSGKPYMLNANEFWLIAREPVVNKLAIWRTDDGGNTFVKTILTQDGYGNNINFTLT